MRSNQIRNGKLGIQNAQQSAKQIVRRDVDRPSMFAMSCAFMAYAAQSLERLRGALRHWPTATPWNSTSVTGGAAVVATTAGSGQRSRSGKCCLAAS